MTTDNIPKPAEEHKPTIDKNEEIAEKKPRKHVKIAIAGIIIILATLLLVWFIIYSEHHPSTNDAYVNANVINIAAQVSGPIVKINVKDQQFVKKGDILFEIDPRPYQYQVDQAQANLQLAYQTMRANEDAVSIAQAQVQQGMVRYAWAQKNAWRFLTLAKGGQVSLADADQAKEDLDQAEATLKASQNQLQQAMQTLGEPGDNNASILAAKATLQTAQLNLSYTKVYATADGYIANFTLREGSTVPAGQTLFELVDNSQWWVDANFKETQIKHIRIGQPAVIEVDTYPGVKFQGEVESLAPASGDSFSLLPPENATGNWVKVTQRIPVRVYFVNLDPNMHLRVGASSTVTINTVAR